MPMGCPECYGELKDISGGQKCKDCGRTFDDIEMAAAGTLDRILGGR